jgi:AcrR family transcriptional regulator
MQSTTRERILDAAMRLFIDQGYDKTSLREIAEALGITKAAVYYHFASKDDILAALHMRLHELLRESLDEMDLTDASPEAWARLMDHVVDGAVVSRDLFVLHERNRAAVEALHANGHHTEDHDDIEHRLQSLLADQSIPVRDRVRMACSFGAAVTGVMMAGDAFASVPSAELASLIREAVNAVLEPART